jgi:hypothetical protein
LAGSACIKNSAASLRWDAAEFSCGKQKNYFQDEQSAGRNAPMDAGFISQPV